MYENFQEEDTVYRKIRRSLYLIVSISLLTHTMSVTYSIMALKEQSAGFISIIVSSIVCFFLSSSHLTIYGISILGIMYLKILQQNGYSRTQLSYVVAMSGIILFPFWKAVHAVDSIFHSLPGRIHASMVFGIALIVLTKFFPLSIENIGAFFIASNADVLTNPIEIIKITFTTFNVLTLALTIVSIIIIYLLRNKLNKIPFIAFLVILGILINIKHYFKSYEDLCMYQGVDCNFYIIKLQNLIQPTLAQIFALLPASIVMTFIVTFEQFLYLEQFQRRGKRLGGGGDLGNVRTQSRVLGLANAISGCLGGFPICINLFATYENFSFNMKYGFKGTKWVGLMQLPVSYLLYSFLKQIFQMIPLFILFTVVATPTIYFVRNMLRIHYRHVIFITVLAAINVLTHPIIGLILACFISIADIAQLLKAAPSEILLQNINMEQGERKSSTLVKVVQKQNNQNKFISEFVSRVIQIQNDKPASLQGSSYVLYRLTGSISYLNFYEHINEMKIMVQKYIKPFQETLIISFRYSQIIDEQSLQQLAYFVERLRDKNIRVVLTGLYPKLLLQMQKMPYFLKMLQQDDRSMYSVPQFD